MFRVIEGQRNGGTEECRDRGIEAQMERWRDGQRNGGTEEWRDRGMKRWRNGGMEV